MMRLTSTLICRLFQTGMSPPFTRCTFANIFSKCVFQLQALLLGLYQC
jgi:hypothetical protein